MEDIGHVSPIESSLKQDKKAVFLLYLRISSSLGKTLKSASLRRTYEEKGKTQLTKLSWLPKRGKVTSIFKHTFFGRGSSFVIVNSERRGKNKTKILFRVVTSIHEILIKNFYFYLFFLLMKYAQYKAILIRLRQQISPKIRCVFFQKLIRTMCLKKN